MSVYVLCVCVSVNARERERLIRKVRRKHAKEGERFRDKHG